MSNKKKTRDYEAATAAALGSEVSFEVRARGNRDTVLGVLVAYIPRGRTLSESKVRLPDEKATEGFEGADQHRPRADVCVVRTTDPATGRTRFFAPRPHQVRWSQ